ncbi:MAG TPA: malate dehydrogenase [Humidesulfovibrio sp.]|uniref:malate dehydrogenase n=1 Tax=Humidesulfovibrio sp. TaxID=2910988 RepID=UPI002CBB0FE4|nr:malate dehydrogenase [Humidesulfovibrio sp.]HWR02476.1 malate dehydrogenase [Humidesulfovibrio sp.]
MPFRRKKISVIGSGQVGATCALMLASRGVGDVVLLDINLGSAKGKALDILQTAAVQLFDSQVQGTADYADTAGSDVVVVTAGSPRRPGLTRDDLLSINAHVVASCCREIKKHSPQAVVIIVTNPLDAMCFVAKRELDFPRERVLGMAGILDSSRFRTFVALELGVSVRDVQALVMGGHGDSMVPMPRHCFVGGVPLTELLEPARIEALVERARRGGDEIVKLLETGSAFYAPAASVVQMAESILRDQRRVLPCAALLEGEFGVSGLFVGVPCVLGGRGLEKVCEIKLDAAERTAFDYSVGRVQALVDDLARLGL